MLIDLYIPHGQTRRFTARVRALPENTERHLLANDGVLVDAAVQSVFSSPLLNLREGSIYLLLNITKDKSFEMRHTATETMTSLVRKMLQSEKVKDSITEKTFVLVEIDETDEDTFLNETFGKRCLPGENVMLTNLFFAPAEAEVTLSFTLVRLYIRPSQICCAFSNFSLP